MCEARAPPSRRRSWHIDFKIPAIYLYGNTNVIVFTTPNKVNGTKFQTVDLGLRS